MLPRRSQSWGDGAEEEPEKPGPSSGSEQGNEQSETKSSGEEAPKDQGAASQDSVQPQAVNAPWTPGQQLAPEQAQQAPGRRQAPRLPSLPASGPNCIPSSVHRPPLRLPRPIPAFHQVSWEVSPTRMALLPPWDPNYEVKAGTRVLWAAGCGSGASYSGRTLWHPSFWPLYETSSGGTSSGGTSSGGTSSGGASSSGANSGGASSGGGSQPQAPGAGQQPAESVARDAGIPVLCREEIFLLDPLLPQGQRVPLLLSEVPQQAMGSLRLLLPPAIMSPLVVPTVTRSTSTAWLTGPELIAVTGLLQMSEGAPRPSTPPQTSPLSGDPPSSADEPQDPEGGQDCPPGPDSDLARSPGPQSQ
ncbi:histone deacetylase complex subunit SAP25 isoform X2 [Ochotona princeps]|uniref:histone deacetylase complex subunit SAP25 isoform X2 n=1 Tax=Ochotona princeps TaxID=9978 RepID=UPI0027149372|nr:histone deacetylase complex subunit SAP25 isoform X2 [Ochotona princeps]